MKSFIDRLVNKSKKHVWHIKDSDSPMSYQIIQQLKKHNFYKTKKISDAIFTDQNISLNEVEAQLFEFKHELCQLVDFMHFDFMPKNCPTCGYEFGYNFDVKKPKRWDSPTLM